MVESIWRMEKSIWILWNNWWYTISLNVWFCNCFRVCLTVDLFWAYCQMFKSRKYFLKISDLIGLCKTWSWSELLISSGPHMSLKNMDINLLYFIGKMKYAFYDVHRGICLLAFVQLFLLVLFIYFSVHWNMQSTCTTVTSPYTCDCAHVYTLGKCQKNWKSLRTLACVCPLSAHTCVIQKFARCWTSLGLVLICTSIHLATC